MKKNDEKIIAVLILVGLLLFSGGLKPQQASVYQENVVNFASHVEKSATGRCDNFDTQNIFVFNPDNIPVKSFQATSKVTAVASGLCQSCYLGGKADITTVTIRQVSNIIYDTTNSNMGDEFKVTSNSAGNFPNICTTTYVIDYQTPAPATAEPYIAPSLQVDECSGLVTFSLLSCWISGTNSLVLLVVLFFVVIVLEILLKKTKKR